MPNVVEQSPFLLGKELRKPVKKEFNIFNICELTSEVSVLDRNFPACVSRLKKVAFILKNKHHNL